MTYRHSTQPSDTHSLQQPTIQANSMNTASIQSHTQEVHHVNNEKHEEKGL